MNTPAARRAVEKQRVPHNKSERLSTFVRSVTVGSATFQLSIADGELKSLGEIQVDGTPLRNPANRFLPWFDTYQGDRFSRFRFEGTDEGPSGVVIHTTAISDPDTMFLEKRDSSGDSILRQGSWDKEPAEAKFSIHLEAAEAEAGGITFRGFRYWFEFESAAMPVHRILDRQTWEVGGHLEGVSVVCRNLFDRPRKMLSIDGEYSTVGLNNWAGLLPGNLWARWSLLPAFDMQYGEAGVLIATFDRVSCIRSVIETRKGEDWLRVIDLHYFEETAAGRTNPKTVLFSPQKLDHTDALNLWTRLHDTEAAKACAQFGMPLEGPPAITFSENLWKNFHFESSYENVMAVAAEFGADQVFIDPVWQNGEAYRQRIAGLAGEEALKEGILGKTAFENMCCSYDFEVAEEFGGEEGLKALCTRARSLGLNVISWMATHYSPRSAFTEKRELGHGSFGVFAGKESGRHPDTGYAGNCWTVNLNAPIAAKIREQVVGLCKRTGLKGYLWDSFSNLGWWQVDYSSGSMRPQFDRMCELYADLVNAGLYIMPEAVVSFSNHSCCGLHGGNVYAGDLLGYSYNSMTGLSYREENDQSGREQGWSADRIEHILRGRIPVDELFRCVAHRRMPSMAIHNVPRKEWDKSGAEALKALFAVYRKVRDGMLVRTVLKEDAGVLWGRSDTPELLFSFKEQPWKGGVTDALTGEIRQGSVLANRVYRLG